MTNLSQSRGPTRWLGWLRDLWLITGMVLLLLLVTDAALKAWLPETNDLTQVSPGAAAPTRAETDALEQAEWAGDYFRELRAARRTAWQPWTYWRRLPFSGRHINIDDDGIRRSWAPPQPTGEVWMLGGSTVWGTAARDEQTLPSHLARELAAAGLPLRVINLGESGYVTGQDQIRLLRRLESEVPPAAVIFYGGVNDVYAALQARRAGLSQNERHRRSDFRVTDGLDNWLAAFPVVLEGVARLAAKLGPAPEVIATDDLADRVAEHYASRVQAVAAVLAARGIPALFAWQPSVFSRARLAGDEADIVAASLSAHRDLQQASDRAVASRLAGWADFIFLGEVFNADDAPYFVDFCHVSEAGNARLAMQLARPLMDRLRQSLND